MTRGQRGNDAVRMRVWSVPPRLSHHTFVLNFQPSLQPDFSLLLLLFSLPFPEYRRADSDHRGSLGDGRFKVARHAHRQGIELQAVFNELLL